MNLKRKLHKAVERVSRIPQKAKQAFIPFLIRNKIPNTSPQTDNPFLITIERSWTDNNCLSLFGWVLSKEMILDNFTITVDNVTVPVTTWYPRPDIHQLYPHYLVQDKCGFFIHIPRQAKHNAVFEVKSDTQTINIPLTFISANNLLPDDYKAPEKDYFGEFINIVNENKLNVLEIGSRIVSPGSSSKRSLFPQANSFIGFDYYPDANTDVVGDVHRLSHYFDENKKVDAIFSVAVFEHLAMPWVAAKEINKLLSIGGYTYHLTVFAWPRHEAPWDFWRFSDDGLRILFSKATGFEVINAGLGLPLRMHVDHMPAGQEQLAMHAGFGTSWILAKKTAEIDDSRIRWDYHLEEILADDHRYPFRS